VIARVGAVQVFASGQSVMRGWQRQSWRSSKTQAPHVQHHRRDFCFRWEGCASRPHRL